MENMQIQSMQIESMEIRNYRVFKQAALVSLPRLAVLVGENGSGKSTLFDLFSFLKDALAQNVAMAVAKRGGFRDLVSRGADGPISIALKFRETGGRLATYELSVALEDNSVVVNREVLKFRRGQRGKPWHFVDSQGVVVLPLPMRPCTESRAPKRNAKSTFLMNRPSWRSRAWGSSRNSV